METRYSHKWTNIFFESKGEELKVLINNRQRSLNSVRKEFVNNGLLKEEDEVRFVYYDKNRKRQDVLALSEIERVKLFADSIPNVKMEKVARKTEFSDAVANGIFEVKAVYFSGKLSCNLDGVCGTVDTLRETAFSYKGIEEDKHDVFVRIGQECLNTRWIDPVELAKRIDGKACFLHIAPKQVIQIQKLILESPLRMEEYGDFQGTLEELANLPRILFGLGENDNLSVKVYVSKGKREITQLSRDDVKFYLNEKREVTLEIESEAFEKKQEEQVNSTESGLKAVLTGNKEQGENKGNKAKTLLEQEVEEQIRREEELEKQREKEQEERKRREIEEQRRKDQEEKKRQKREKQEEERKKQEKKLELEFEEERKKFQREALKTKESKQKDKRDKMKAKMSQKVNKQQEERKIKAEEEKLGFYKNEQIKREEEKRRKEREEEERRLKIKQDIKKEELRKIQVSEHKERLFSLLETKEIKHVCCICETEIKEIVFVSLNQPNSAFCEKCESAHIHHCFLKKFKELTVEEERLFVASQMENKRNLPEIRFTAATPEITGEQGEIGKIVVKVENKTAQYIKTSEIKLVCKANEEFWTVNLFESGSIYPKMPKFIEIPVKIQSKHTFLLEISPVCAEAKTNSLKIRVNVDNLKEIKQTITHVWPNLNPYKANLLASTIRNHNLQENRAYEALIKAKWNPKNLNI